MAKPPSKLVFEMVNVNSRAAIPIGTVIINGKGKVQTVMVATGMTVYELCHDDNGDVEPLRRVYRLRLSKPRKGK